MIALSPRLKAAADMVRSGVVVADIGTDHAYLPSYLVMSGRCPRAIACDLRQKPLENARESLERYSLEDRIELRLSDGLGALSPGDAQDIVITGMGGILITKILSSAGWPIGSEQRLVLQPMTHAEDLRDYLCKNGFKILRETACEDEGRLYAVICAAFGSSRSSYPPGYEYYGELDSGDEVAARYVGKQYRRMKKRALALRKAGLCPEEAQRCEKICDGIEAFLGGRNNG